MKKLVFAAIAAMFATTVVNAQNSLGLNDYQMVNEKARQEHFLDEVLFSVGSKPGEYQAMSFAKDGLGVGITGGYQHWAGHDVPYIGGEVIYEGGRKLPFGADLAVTFAPGFYTEEADRDNKELEVNLRVGPMVRVFTTHNKEFRLYVEPYYSYKQHWDFHERQDVTTVVREDEYEIVKTTDVVSHKSEFIGSTKGFGLMFKLIYNPWGTRHSFHLNAGIERQQRYYDTGNIWKTGAYAGFSWTINISSMWSKNKLFFQKTKMTTKQAKKASKDPNSGLYRR